MREPGIVWLIHAKTSGGSGKTEGTEGKRRTERTHLVWPRLCDRNLPLHSHLPLLVHVTLLVCCVLRAACLLAACCWLFLACCLAVAAASGQCNIGRCQGIQCGLDRDCSLTNVALRALHLGQKRSCCGHVTLFPPAPLPFYLLFLQQGWVYFRQLQPMHVPRAPFPL